MKFLICVSCLSYGGAERVAVSWANALDALGHDVTVMADFNHPESYKLAPGVKRLQAKAGRETSLWRKISKNVALTIQLRRFCKQNKIDVVISVLHYRVIPMLLALKTLRHRPLLIQTDHNDYQHALKLSHFNKKWLNKFFFSRFFDILTVLTEQDKSILDHMGRKNVYVLHNPLFLSPVSEIPQKSKTVLAMGRVDDWHYKGFDLLVQAWNQVGERHQDWTLKIVGCADDKSLQKLNGLHRGPSALQFVPYTENVVKEFAEASIFVLSSRNEAWGLVLVEAMSQGCAAVACDNFGRQAEIIQHGLNGLLCQPRDITALADAMETLISDEILRAKLQHAAPPSVARFNEIDTAKNLLKIIDSHSKAN